MRLHPYRKDVLRTLRNIIIRIAAVLVAATSVTPAWGGACPETLTLAEMVDCFGAGEAGGGANGASPESPQAKGSEGVPVSPPEEGLNPHTDMDC